MYWDVHHRRSTPRGMLTIAEYDDAGTAADVDDGGCHDRCEGASGQSSSRVQIPSSHQRHLIAANRPCGRASGMSCDCPTTATTTTTRTTISRTFVDSSSWTDTFFVDGSGPFLHSLCVCVCVSVSSRVAQWLYSSTGYKKIQKTPRRQLDVT